MQYSFPLPAAFRPFALARPFSPSHPSSPFRSFAAFLLLLLALSPTLAKSQSAKPSSEILKDWNIDAGLTVAHPLRYMNMFSGMGIGVDGSLTHPFSNGLAVGGRVNYAYFFGRKSEEAGFLDGATRFPAANMINILGDAHYMLPEKILLGVDLGLGMILYNGATSNSFAKIFYAGYQWDQGAHIYTFSLYFDQTTYQKNLGLRAAIRL